MFTLHELFPQSAQEVQCSLLLASQNLLTFQYTGEAMKELCNCCILLKNLVGIKYFLGVSDVGKQEMTMLKEEQMHQAGVVNGNLI